MKLLEIFIKYNFINYKLDKKEVISIFGNNSIKDRIAFTKRYLEYKNKDPDKVDALIKLIPMFGEGITNQVIQDAVKEFNCILVLSKRGEILKIY